jgi:uncharacterized membrane protein
VTAVPDDDSGLAAAAATRRDVDRLVAFSDGVFAIAITLLVLNLTVPQVAAKELGDNLRDLLPELFAYGLSFVVIGSYWMGHHQTFRSLLRVDRKLLWLNLAVLAFVALLPFPTEVLGKYGDTTLATVIYAGTLVAVGSLSVLLWWYINAAGLNAPTDPAFVRLEILRGAVAPFVFAVSVPIALVDAAAAKLWWLALIPLNIYVERRYAKAVEDPG